MNVPCGFFFFFFGGGGGGSCCLHVDSNLHGDINVTVMFSPRPVKQNH